MSVYLTIPSARPNAGTVPLWRELGYKIALWRDQEDGVREWLGADGLVIVGPYPGYARAVNALTKAVMNVDSQAGWMVAGGDDTLPDPNHSPEEVARQCSDHFAFGRGPAIDPRNGIEITRWESIETFGVMQPTGDRWAAGSIDRICGSPWLGRQFCEQAYGGKGPLFDGYAHMFCDEELLHVAKRLGVLWQRRDLTHMHNHFLRTPAGVNYAATPPPHLVKWNTQQHWNESQALFESREAAGFPGHEPLGMNALAVA